ncbi:MAG: hypothetical protein JRI83_12850 [Deltaproteobacteria bacterium]|nr:hypothetical protein [Deltaproteobacteria bacterium]MBW2132877.1 hypothetical protein [Deltaproteobacteria bacterium]
MIFIDTHAHLYTCFPTDLFFHRSQQNFEKAAGPFGNSSWQAVLFLLDAPGTRDFPGNRKEGHGKDWRFVQTREEASVKAESDSGSPLFLITGKQVVSREGLEVLALGCRGVFPPDLPLEELVKRIDDVGAIPGVPWGFGKWAGRRGRVLSRLLSRTLPGTFFLGENGGRPKSFPLPLPMKTAMKKGIPVLRGSDPLPLPSEVRKPGGFGFMIRETLDPFQPFAHIRELIFRKHIQKIDYGTAASLGSCLKNQLALTIGKGKSS